MDAGRSALGAAHKQIAGSVAGRAAGYGFPGVRVDGNDVFEVNRAVKEASIRALRGEGPTLIEAMLYRISPHSTADDDMLYRTKEEVAYFKHKDGVQQYRRYLLDCGIMSEEEDLSLNESVMKEIDEAIEYADRAPYPATEDTLRHVYAEE